METEEIVYFIYATRIAKNLNEARAYFNELHRRGFDAKIKKVIYYY